MKIKLLAILLLGLMAQTASAQVGTKVEVSSATHPDPETVYEENDIELSWERPTGAYGFSFVLDQEPDTVPDDKLDTTITTKKSYQDIEDGVWYFHIKSRDEGIYSFNEPTHFKIQIDSTPEPVAATQSEVVDDLQSDNQPANSNKFLNLLNRGVSLPFYVVIGSLLGFLLLLVAILMLLRQNRKSVQHQIQRIDLRSEPLKNESVQVVAPVIKRKPAVRRKTTAVKRLRRTKVKPSSGPEEPELTA